MVDVDLRPSLHSGCNGFFISQGVAILFRHRTEWVEVLVEASKNLLAGRDMAPGSRYVYPPFFTLVPLPFTLLPQALSQLIFYMISSACPVYVVKSALSPTALKGVTFLLYAMLVLPPVYAMRRQRRMGDPVLDKPDANASEFSIANTNSLPYR